MAVLFLIALIESLMAYVSSAICCVSVFGSSGSLELIESASSFRVSDGAVKTKMIRLSLQLSDPIITTPSKHYVGLFFGSIYFTNR